MTAPASLIVKLVGLPWPRGPIATIQRIVDETLRRAKQRVAARLAGPAPCGGVALWRLWSGL